MPDGPARDGPVTAPGCPVCHAPLTGRTDQQFCSPALRQKAHRQRTNPPLSAPPAGRSRGEHAVHEYDDCGQRLAGQQWRPDCQRPCRRIDPGGTSPAAPTPSPSATSRRPSLTCFISAGAVRDHAAGLDLGALAPRSTTSSGANRPTPLAFWTDRTASSGATARSALPSSAASATACRYSVFVQAARLRAYDPDALGQHRPASGQIEVQGQAAASYGEWARRTRGAGNAPSSPWRSTRKPHGRKPGS